MNPLKMLGSVMLMAVVAMAAAGASSAMAEPTGLCATEASEENPCESVITSVHEVSVGKVKLLSSLVNPECDVLFSGEATEGSPLTVKGKFTYTNCGTCKVEEVNGPAVITLLKEGHETASVSGSGELSVNCSGLICFYRGEKLPGTAKGPLLAEQKNGEVSIQGQTVKLVKGVFCPTTGKLDITTTPLSPTYIVGQMLCVARVGGAWEEPDPNNFYRCKNRVGPGNGSWELISH